MKKELLEMARSASNNKRWTKEEIDQMQEFVDDGQITAKGISQIKQHTLFGHRSNTAIDSMFSRLKNAEK